MTTPRKQKSLPLKKAPECHSTFLKFLLTEYSALRTEITQSIAKQHSIAMGGYGLAAAMAGHLVTNNAWAGLVVIPMIFTAMISLWAVECNRMVRASYYLAYESWKQLKIEIVALEGFGGWESWIRENSGDAGEFKNMQNMFQLIVVLWVPALLSLVALIPFSIEVFPNANRLMIFIGAFILVALVTGLFYWKIRLISNLAALKRT